MTNAATTVCRISWNMESMSLEGKEETHKKSHEGNSEELDGAGHLITLCHSETVNKVNFESGGRVSD